MTAILEEHAGVCSFTYPGQLFMELFDRRLGAKLRIPPSSSDTLWVGCA